jgi:hypothetical protein
MYLTAGGKATGKTVTVSISKNGGAYGAASGSATEVGSSGNYSWAGNATDRDTLGELRCVASAADCDDTEFTITIAAYDPFAVLDSNVVEISGDSDAADNAEAFFDGTGYAGTNNVIPTVTDLTNEPAGIATLQTDMDDLLDNRLTSTRAGYLDNLSGGTIATQSDVLAINQSASRRLIISTISVYERPTSGDTAIEYQIELRLYDEDGSPVNDDSAPTFTATGTISGNLDANLTAQTNPATGVYRCGYTVEDSHAIEQVRIEGNATIDTATFNISCFTMVADYTAATFNTTDRSNIQTVYDRLTNMTQDNSGNFEWSSHMQTHTVNLAKTALEDFHLDHLLAVGYDSTAPIGDSSSLLRSVFEDGSGLPRFTAASLVNAPGLSVSGLLDAANGIETGLTVRQGFRLMVAAAGNKCSGGGSTTVRFRDYGDTKNRIVATVDANGNRTAITYDLT